MLEMDPTKVIRLPLILLLLSALTSACEPNMDEDERVFNFLDTLRVLAIASQPADLKPGETTTLSALIYEPADRDISYSWSWCPVRNGADEGFTCALEEETFRALWVGLDLGEEPPPYDLGTGETAQFKNVFSTERVEEICKTLLAEMESNELAMLACTEGLDVSVRLEVSTETESVKALKSLVLLEEDIEETERNINPEIADEIVVYEKDQETPLDADATLKDGQTYDLDLGLGEEQAETFLPEPEPGETDSVERKETLVMTWFITLGRTVSDNPLEEGEPGPQSLRTTFVDGSSDFATLLENRWEIPQPSFARYAWIYLVLRDERGGVGWTQHRFSIGWAE